jgi:hypothetical protein
MNPKVSSISNRALRGMDQEAICCRNRMINMNRLDNHVAYADLVASSKAPIAMLAIAAKAAGLFGTLQKKPGAYAKIDWDVRV